MLPHPASSSTSRAGVYHSLTASSTSPAQSAASRLLLAAHSSANPQDEPHNFQGSPPDTIKQERTQTAPKRGYRACTNCRLRKAKCDLGDVTAPSEPPCSRCRREQRDCVFLPSKRRRHRSVSDANPKDTTSLPAETYPSRGGPAPTNIEPPPGGQHQQFFGTNTSATLTSPGNNAKLQPGKAAAFQVDQTATWPSVTTSTQASTSTGDFSKASYPAKYSIGSNHHNETTTPGSMGGSSSASTSALSPSHRTKRRRTDADERKIVHASVSNEMDALEILANAATDGEGNMRIQTEGSSKKVAWDIGDEGKPVVRELNEFYLIKSGVLDEPGLKYLVNIFFQHYHPTLPIFQTARIPQTGEQLKELAHNDGFLLTCIILVASRHTAEVQYKAVHDKAWTVVKDVMSDYSFAGLPGSVGFVEGVLLLAEHLPRDLATPPKAVSVDMLSGTETESAGVHGTDNRRSWALIGVAIRAAYLLGLDQISLEVDEARRTPDVERARSAWTWCYLYDRTIGLRTGLAFWSRGPSLCFIGYSHISQTGEAAARYNFPLQLSPSGEVDGVPRDDSASLMQSLVEITQIMSNAHEVLYPSKRRTEVLVKQGEYFLFLDHFRSALDNYSTIWKPKRWADPTLEELSWMTFHYVRLYISSFGYSAHVKRAQWRAEEERLAEGVGIRHPLQLFPRGSASSPDALYIYDSINAANEILHIALKFAQMGSLKYLPSRYLINISYAAVFALKSSYSGAVAETEMKRIRDLVEHVCTGLALSCPDKDHHAVRYGQMLRLLSKKLLELHDASAVPSRYPSPEPLESGPDATNANQHNGNPANLSHNHVSSPNLQPPLFLDLPLLNENHPYYLETALGDPDNPVFDYGDTNFDFDLEGFWDDFTLGEGSGFPFK